MSKPKSSKPRRLTPELRRRLVSFVSGTFRTFGGGHVTQGNPISHALKDSAPMFAAGVDVEQVVVLVAKCALNPKLILKIK